MTGSVAPAASGEASPGIGSLRPFIAKYGVILAMVVTFAGFSLAKPDSFFTVLTLKAIPRDAAPLLVVAGFTDSVNTNLFDGRMMTLPVYIFTQYATSTEKGYAYAWGGALVLILIVMVLNLVARVIGKVFAPKTGR